MEEDKLSAILKSINTGEFSVSSFQETLFYLLERRKGKSIIEALLQAEADSSAQTSETSTPEQIDISNTHKKIVQLLINSAENYNFYALENLTVLHYASKHGWLGIVQSLLKKGADPNVRDLHNDTPLMLAVQSLQKDVADLLIESGADILCRTNVNYTLLHAASEKGWLEFAQFLLNKGVDPNTATKRGFTPLDFAIQGSSREVISLLVDSGADLNSCKLSMEKLLDFAAKNGHLQVLQYFVEKGAPTLVLIFKLLDVGQKYEQFEIVEFVVKTALVMLEMNVTPLQFLLSYYQPSSKLIQSFIESGAYFGSLFTVYKLPALKVNALQNTQICTQAIINKFNNKDLPDLYKLPLSVKKFPSIDKLIIKSRGMIQDIEQSVRREIETNAFCNVQYPKVISLSMMSVTAYIDYYDDLQKRYRLKRPATVNSKEPFEIPKKIAMLRLCAAFDEKGVFTNFV